MNANAPEKTAVTVCLIEDDDAILRGCAQALLLEGFEVRGYADAAAFLHAERPEFPVIVMTGQGDIGMAVESMREGAVDFIEKPFSPDRLTTTVRNAVDKARLVYQVTALSKEQAIGAPVFIGHSERVRLLKQQIGALAPTGVDIDRKSTRLNS